MSAAVPGVWEREGPETALPPARDCPLPGALRSRGEKLINQQFWLWGQDVRRPVGNLLRAYGFSHYRPPVGDEGSTVYLLPGHELALWGFGLLARWEGCPEIYLGRFRLEPRIPAEKIVPQRVWQPGRLPSLASPRGEMAWRGALGTLVATMNWIADYETWVAHAAGSGYRPACLERWPRAVCGGDGIIAAWREMAAIYASCLPRPETS